MVNVTSIVDTAGNYGLKAVELIPNSTVTDATTTLSVPTQIAKYIIVGIIILFIWKFILRR